MTHTEGGRDLHAYMMKFESVNATSNTCPIENPQLDSPVFDVTRKNLFVQVRGIGGDIYVKPWIPGFNTRFKFDKILSRQGVVQVSCGFSHCMALTKYGRVFTWGSNDCGQLGIGKHVKTTETMLNYLSLEQKASSVSAGFGHSMCLLEDYTVAAWGLNTHGQLGTNDVSSRYRPTIVATDRFMRPDFIACGPLFSLLGNMDGVVCVSGRIFVKDLMDSVMQTKSFIVVMEPPRFELPRGVLVILKTPIFNSII